MCEISTGVFQCCEDCCGGKIRECKGYTATDGTALELCCAKGKAAAVTGSGGCCWCPVVCIERVGDASALLTTVSIHNCSRDCVTASAARQATATPVVSLRM